MLAGIPTHYVVSCRVRNTECGIDATPTEHGGEVIEAPTAMAAFAIMVSGESGKGCWLRCSPEALKSLLAMRDIEAFPGNERDTRTELELMGWDSFEDGGDKSRDGYHNDWNTNHLEYDEEKHTVEITGTSCLGEFEFEISIKPQVSNEETEPTQEYTDARYLMALSERIFRIAPVHGVDQGDYEELREIAGRLAEQARMDHLNESADADV
jgi:hypothetical protein